MALFGVPTPYPDHARRAVAAAIDMQAALMGLQARWWAEGMPAIDIGIGINTGPLVVGNIGSRHRLDFTVIGDTVNPAERLEKLNRQLGTRILIAQPTYELVKEAVRVRGPLHVQVEGRAQEIAVYEVLGWQTGQPRSEDRSPDLPRGRGAWQPLSPAQRSGP